MWRKVIPCGKPSRWKGMMLCLSSVLKRNYKFTLKRRTKISAGSLTWCGAKDPISMLGHLSLTGAVRPRPKSWIHCAEKQEASGAHHWHLIRMALNSFNSVQSVLNLMRSFCCTINLFSMHENHPVTSFVCRSDWHSFKYPEPQCFHEDS